MPWTANSIFEARRNFVLLALSPKSNIRRLCRQFNISPKTGYQTLHRYRTEGESGLRDRSRAPQRRPSRSSKATELAILSIRADHPRWGGRRIASHLELLGAAVVPAPSTIWTGIRKLPSGSCVTFTADVSPGGMPAPRPYWSLSEVVVAAQEKRITDEQEAVAAPR